MSGVITIRPMPAHARQRSPHRRHRAPGRAAARAVSVVLLSQAIGAGGEPRGVGIEIARALAARIGVALQSHRICRRRPRSSRRSRPARATWRCSASIRCAAGTWSSRRRCSRPTSPISWRKIPPRERSPTPTGRARASRWCAITPWTPRCAASSPTRSRFMPTRRTRRSRCFAPAQADVLAGIRPGLLMYAGKMPGTRVLDDRYGRNVIALAVKKGEAARLSYVSEFAGQARADGTVTRAIASAGLRGVDMA